MKYISIALIGLLVLSSVYSSFLKRTETNSCRMSQYYIAPIVYDPFYVSPLYTWTSYTYLYNPVVVAPTTTVTLVSLGKKAAKEVKFSVVHDNDLEKYDVKGNLFHRNEATKESWFVHDKVDEKVKEALKSCKDVHEKLSKEQFKNVDKSKVAKILPEVLTPKKVVANKVAAKAVEVKRPEPPRPTRPGKTTEDKVDDSKRPPPPQGPPHHPNTVANRVEEKKTETKVKDCKTEKC